MLDYQSAKWLKIQEKTTAKVQLTNAVKRTTQSQTLGQSAIPPQGDFLMASKMAIHSKEFGKKTRQ